MVPYCVQNYTVDDICDYDQLCYTHILKMILTFSVVDSWAKPERGILNGNLDWIGAYDQCINITSSGSHNPANTESDYRAQYCTLQLSVALNVCLIVMAVISYVATQNY